MKGIILLCSLFLCTLIHTGLNAQDVKRGNLLRIDISKDSISYTDTLGSWSDVEYSNSGDFSKYTDHFTMSSGKEYFIRSENKWTFYGGIMPSGSGQFYITEPGKPLTQKRKISWTVYGNDAPSRFMTDRTHMFRTDCGLWLMNGDLGNSFLYNNDSLVVINDISWFAPKDIRGRFTIIIGQIGSKALAVFRGTDPQASSEAYELRLLNNPGYPDISENTAEKITYKKDPAHFSINWPLRLTKLPGNDSLFLVLTFDDGFNLFRFSKDTLGFVKKMLDDYNTNIDGSEEYILKEDGSFYLFRTNTLIKYDYDSLNRDFTNSRIIFRQPEYYTIHDRDFRYLAAIGKDSLLIFDIHQEKFIRQYNLPGVKNPYALSPFMDPPYIYIHNVVSEYTGVENEKKTEIKDYRLSAYPNPFNSSAKIEYSLPEDKQIEISIFDMLGRKVTSLVKGLERKGDHTVMFDASGLPSGIYLYNLTAGSFSRSGKIVLMK